MLTFDLPDLAKERDNCLDFLQNFSSPDGGISPYRLQLQEIANRQRKVLRVFVDDIVSYMDRRSDTDFANNVRSNTSRYIKLFEEAAESLLPARTVPVQEMDIFDILQDQRQRSQIGAAELATSGSLFRRYEVSIIPSASERPRKLREIRAADLGHLVKVKGLVTRASDVKPYVTVCTYTCDACGGEIFQPINGPQYMPLQRCPSQRCKDNKTTGRIVQQTRGSSFVKYQEFRLQELPDQVPVGHIPRSLTVHCRGEQTRLCGPGDVVTVCGIFQTVRVGGFKALLAGLQADTYIEATDIEKEKLSYSAVQQTNDTDLLVHEIGSEPDPYGRLASSIAPEIFGHEDVKKALLLQLVSGVTRVLSDGMKIRGDINILLMGDPGVAKSQLLKYIATVSPRGVYTTGKGSSGVGLTASVVRDNLTGDMALEGGALVLADMGVCCIDEFDKMDEGDRTAIHEVMEQQTISIAKAGITTTLNARAAVLAAANPLYGRYNRRKSVSDNIDLPNSLLSRFDLLFLILDKADMETDLALSRHVLHVHKFLKKPESNFRPLPPSAVKQYIAAARTIHPEIPADLTSYIVEAYVAMRIQDSNSSSIMSKRSRNSDQTIMTARQLLSILRLSQALARLRLAPLTSHDDVDEAIRLIHSSKASLNDDTPSGPKEDPVASIFSLISNMASGKSATSNSSSGSGSGCITLSFAQIEAMVLKKGFSSQQLQTCLHEYEQLGVISMDADGSHVIVDA